MVQSNAVLKSYLETNDVPTQAQFIDLVDTITASNIRTLVYTVGVAGTTGMNHYFTSVANTTEQSIQLGGTTIIPANSDIISIVAKCTSGINAGTGTSDVGNVSGGDQFMLAINADNTNEIIKSTTNIISSSATSVYFSFTPTSNWNLLTTGQWKIWISVIDNSTN